MPLENEKFHRSFAASIYDIFGLLTTCIYVEEQWNWRCKKLVLGHCPFFKSAIFVKKTTTAIKFCTCLYYFSIENIIILLLAYIIFQLKMV